MIPQKLIIRTIFATVATFCFANSFYFSKSLGQVQSKPTYVVDEVWQILNQSYVDGSFNLQDWQAIRQEYLNRPYSSKQQAYMAIREMVAKLGDRYTSFFDPQEFQALDGELAGNLSGIGVELMENEKTKALTVITPIKGSPAFTAGILPEDVILQIDSKSTGGMSLANAVKKIQGAVGTKIVLTIKRGHQKRVFKLIRANIHIYPITYQTKKTPTGKIGYIQVPEFTETASAEMQRAIQALEQQKVQGYILDLRSDPGGLLESSLQIASMWLKQGEIVSLVNREQVKQHYEATGKPLTNKPLVVLVNQGSASASEILAGALQDDHRAKLVGTRTFGKGLVQSVEPLSDGSAIKFTIAKYYTPKGRDINHVGILPDVKVELTAKQQKELLKKQAFGTLADPQYTIALANLNQLMRTARVNSKYPTR
jgi:carboxyl-terminal processing protease